MGDRTKDAIPETEGVKYAGSKRLLLGAILSIVRSVPVSKIFDGFSGTTRVSQALARSGYAVCANDTSYLSEAFANTYLKSTKPDSFYQEIIDELNSLSGIDGWWTENYGGEANDVKLPFQKHNTRKIDAIRQKIAQLGLGRIDESVLLTSLMLAMDSVDSTIGHFASYLKKWSTRSYGEMRLALPKRFKTDQAANCVLRQDVFDAILSGHYDLAYLDPPYGSNNEKMPPSRVRYNSYYHIWKSLVLDDKPELFGKAQRRVDSHDCDSASVFEEYRKNELTGRYLAIEALDRLIRKIDCHYILLSYSSGGRATKESLLEALSANGRIISLSAIDYRRNVMADMKWSLKWAKEDTRNTEYLFLVEKK